MGYIALGDLISKAQVEKCGKREYPVLSMTMHDGIVFQNDRFKKDIASIDRSNYSVVGFNQLVVSFPIDEGVLAVQDITDAGIVSPAYKIWDIDQAKLVPKYLEMWLRSPRSIDYYKSKLRGTTARRRSIPEEDFLGMRVNVPPKEEQERIVDLLTRVKGVMLLREQELVVLDELIKARFVEMFGDPVSNSMRLPVECMGERYTLKAGITTSADEIHDFSAGEYEIPCYGGNGIRGYVENASCDGSFPIIGRQGALCGNVKFASGRFHATEHAVLVSTLKDDDPIWTYYMLQMMDLYRFHTGAAQPGLAVKTLNTVDVIVTNKERQKEFVAFVEQIDKSKSVIQKSLDETQLLFDSLMQKYFG